MTTTDKQLSKQETEPEPKQLTNQEVGDQWPDLSQLTSEKKMELEKIILNLMGQNDTSHNAEHAQQVAGLAVRLAKSEGITDSNQLDFIWLLGLCHDVGDHKYPQADWKKTTLHITLTGQLSPVIANQIQELVGKISWSAEKKSLAQGKPFQASNLIAVRCVQDADRLQAIGALGIARCFAFGASPAGLQLVPTHEKCSLLSQRAHFEEKLFRLTFHTQLGQQMAKGRMEFMKLFCQQFDLEWSEATEFNKVKI